MSISESSVKRLLGSQRNIDEPVMKSQQRWTKALKLSWSDSWKIPRTKICLKKKPKHQEQERTCKYRETVFSRNQLRSSKENFFREQPENVENNGESEKVTEDMLGGNLSHKIVCFTLHYR